MTPPKTTRQLRKGEPVAAHVYIAGRVQGVCFRMETLVEAQRRGLSGWVRNLPDGRVEALFSGARPAVEAMVQWCHRGPSAAHVARVDVAWQAPLANATGFSVC